jgi:hypothetical protein
MPRKPVTPRLIGEHDVLNFRASVIPPSSLFTFLFDATIRAFVRSLDPESAYVRRSVKSCRLWETPFPSRQVSRDSEPMDRNVARIKLND